MAVTLEQAKLNAVEDYDPAILDEFRRNSALLDALQFDQAVNPAGGGATLSYGYRRLKTTRGADFRAYNTEYKPAEATTETFNVTLSPLGGSFEVDRILANIGPAATNEVAFQMAELIKAASQRFQDAVINGDTAVDTNGFDGLDKALKDSSTELVGGKDWSAFADANAAMQVLDDLDDLLSLLDGPPTILMANRKVLAKIRAAARRANMYTQVPVSGLVGTNGHEVMREQYGNLTIIDPGVKAGSNEDIIPVVEGKSNLYVIRTALDGFHGVTTLNGNMVKSWLPDFSTAGAVKKGEVELGPLAVVLKKTRAAAVMRDIKVA